MMRGMETAPGPPVATKPRFKRMRRAAVFLVALYLALCLTMYSFQARLLFPGRSTQGQPLASRIDTPATEIVRFRAKDGTALAGRFAAAADAEHAPTVLYFYGNASCAAWSIDEVNLLRDLGCNVFVPDFEGYGMSGGSPSEAGFYATATAAWEYLRARPGIDRAKVVVMGWSIGSAVAIDLASREPAAGLITLSAFTRLADIARVHYPYLPVRLILKYGFDNLAKMPAIHCPTLIVHGEWDDLVPPTMAGVLTAAAGDREAEHLVLHGADHNTVFSVDTPRLRQAMQRLLARVNPGTTTAAGGVPRQPARG